MRGDPIESFEIPDGWKEDASIRDVFFLDDRLGWAVGDRGTILRTSDGGSHWTLVRSRTSSIDSRPLAEKLTNPIAANSTAGSGAINCQLTSVHFVDAQHGWIAGRYSVPLIDRTRGVVLRTSDGGMTWEPVQGLVLPGLSQVRFLDRQRGWAIGDAGSLYRSGVYYTQDGGRTWSTQGESADRDWIDAAWLDDHTRLLVDPSGSIAVQRPGGFEWSVAIQDPRPVFRSIAMASEREGWAVGAHGAIFQTRDGGATWTPLEAEADLPPGDFHFHTVAVQNQNVWFAGAPGTHVFSLDRASGRLRAFPTSTRVPIHRIFSPDGERVFAVGDLGTIIASGDGGTTWKTQRPGASRLGMLVLAESPRDIPFSLLARFSTEQNRICGVICLDGSAAREIEPALSRIGCVAIDGELETDSSRADQATGRELFSVDRLVRQIRTWRPDIVVAVSRDHSFELVAASREAIRRAASNSGSDDGVPLTERLGAWSVERLIYEDTTGESTMVIDDQKLLAGVGQILGDLVALSRMHVEAGAALSSRAVRYTIEDTRDQQPIMRADPFVDLPLSPRRQSRARLGNLATINRAATKRQAISQLAAWEIHSAMDWVAWRSQIQTYAMGLDPDTMGIWLVQLAQAYLDEGRTELCVATLEHFLTRVSDHPLEPSILLALARYYASDECGNVALRRAMQRNELGPDPAVQQAGGRAVARPVQQGGATVVAWQPVTGEGSVGTAEAKGELSAETRSLYRRQRLEQASRFLARLKSMDPDFSLSADVRWLEASILSKLRGPAFAKNLWQQIVRSANSPPTLIAAAAREIRELETGGGSSAWHSFRAATRPVLDGQLDDDVWQAAMEMGAQRFEKVLPQLADGRARTDVVWLAHDDEFLFIAARCHMIDGQAYADVGLTRRRDADLSSQDRIELCLDLDRDAACPIELVVDQRGWGAERVAGDRSWDPQWYIARAQHGDTWIVEAAIAWRELGLERAPEVIAARLSRHRYDGMPVWESCNATTLCGGAGGQWTDWVHADGAGYQRLELNPHDE